MKRYILLILTLLALASPSLKADSPETRFKVDYLHTVGRAADDWYAGYFKYWGLEFGTQLRFRLHRALFFQGEAYLGYDRRFKPEDNDMVGGSFRRNSKGSSIILGIDGMIGVSGRAVNSPLLRHIDIYTGPDIRLDALMWRSHSNNSTMSNSDFNRLNVGWRFGLAFNVARYSINLGYEIALTDRMKESYFRHRGLDTIRVGIAYTL